MSATAVSFARTDSLPGASASLPSLAVTIGSSTFGDKTTSWLEGTHSMFGDKTNSWLEGTRSTFGETTCASSTSMQLRAQRTAMLVEDDEDDEGVEKAAREVRKRTSGPVKLPQEDDDKEENNHRQAVREVRKRTNGPVDMLPPDELDVPNRAPLSIKSRTSMLHEIDCAETRKNMRSRTAMLD
mmetsp:Transcript_158491/g.292353  ORF Transcript_158491/g.292353 Transcript_158491/m.292353 type:complete len:184 (-) Transcript_158491:292-843(-)